MMLGKRFYLSHSHPGAISSCPCIWQSLETFLVFTIGRWSATSSQWIEATDAAEHPAGHRRALPQKS